MSGNVAPHGELRIKKIPRLVRPAITSLADAVKYGTSNHPFTAKARWQRKNRENFERSLDDQDLFDHGRLFAIGHLWLAKIDTKGDVHDLGLASCRVVTDTGVQYIVDAMQNIVELEAMKYHGLGTGTTAESAAQTALVTELTTGYSTASTRPTGTLAEKAATPNCFETVATITVSATTAATEHGIFSQAATGGGVMLDRTLFTVVNLASTESILATYDLTFPSGS